MTDLLKDSSIYIPTKLKKRLSGIVVQLGSHPNLHKAASVIIDKLDGSVLHYSGTEKGNIFIPARPFLLDNIIDLFKERNLGPWIVESTKEKMDSGL